MRFSLRNLVLSSVALCSTTAFAANQTRVHVPFNFVVKNHAYQAGSYNVELDPMSSSVKLISIEKGTTPMMWILWPGGVDGGANLPTVALTFDVTGEEHVLRTIRYGTMITPNLDTRPKHRVDSIMTIGE